MSAPRSKASHWEADSDAAPPRLMGRDDAVGRLVRAGKTEAPAARGRARALEAALGVGAGTAGLAVAFNALKSIALRKTAVSLAWMGLGVAPIAVAAVAAHVWLTPASSAGEGRSAQRENAPAAPIVETVSPAAAAAESAAPSASAAPADVRLLVEPAARTADIPPRATVHAASREPTKPRVTEPMDAELDLLQRARKALLAGDGKTAGAELDRHDKAFRDGPFAEEAAAMRVEALANSGSAAHDEARAAAARFAATYPASPYRARLTRIVEASLR